MAPEVQKNVEYILEGKVRYTSNNLGLNMLISKLQRKVSENPSSMGDCLSEIDNFFSKYQTMMAGEVKRIAEL